MPESESFESLRPLMFSIAYRMLASVSDAEDVIQDAFLRYQGVLEAGLEIGSLKAFLSAVVTRLSIDELRSAKARREVYAGQWLPEPFVTPGDANPDVHAEQAESLSMAFLLLLERLNPVERAIFLLHDVFGYGYPEIAAIVDKEANCRQIAARARRRVQSERPRFDVSREETDQLVDRFVGAMTRGDVLGLVELLAEDVAVYGDGGGKAPQWTRHRSRRFRQSPVCRPRAADERAPDSARHHANQRSAGRHLSRHRGPHYQRLRL
jgi:RNA polymerase sigma-70 factor, ECF subfamily